MQLTTLGAKKENTEKKIIFINRFFWPDVSATSQLLSDLAEHMTSNGSRVTVITSRLHYASQKKLASTQQHKGVNIHRVWSTSFDRSSLVGRMLDFLSFCIFATFTLLKQVKAGDVVVAKTDPPLIQVFAWFAASAKRAKIVHWCQDLFPEAAFALLESKKQGILGTLLYKLRNLALKNSDLTVTVSNEMRNTLLSQGINKERVIVIRNWCDRRISPVQRNKNTLRDRWQLKDEFVLGYSGNLGRAHVPDKIYGLIRELSDVPKLKFLFIGSGHGMAWLKAKCENEGFSQVTFEAYQPLDNLSLSLSVPDVHLISLASGSQSFMAPSKFYGALAAGRPIAFLGDPDSELAQEISRIRCGVTLPLGHRDEWRSLVLNLTENETERSIMGQNARNAYEQMFAPSVPLAAWQRIIETEPTAESIPVMQTNLENASLSEPLGSEKVSNVGG